MAFSIPERPYSSVERHPQYQEIVDLMLAGVPDKDISKRLKPTIERTTLWRWRTTKLQQRMQQAAQVPATVAMALQDAGLLKDGAEVNQAVKAVVDATKASLAVDPYLARIAKHQATIDDALLDARSEKDARGVASLVGTDLKGIELHGRFTGRLAGQEGPSIAIQIVCPAGSQPEVRQAEGGVVVDITPGR